MGRSQETFGKKEIRNKKEKKRKEKEARRLARRDQEKKGGLDDMIAYVDSNGVITDTPPDLQDKEEIDADSIVIGVPQREEEEETDRQGILNFFNDSKGFGFIRDLQTKESIFVHINNFIDKDIIEGNKVSFLTEKGPKGLTAVQVKKIK